MLPLRVPYTTPSFLFRLFVTPESAILYPLSPVKIMCNPRENLNLPPDFYLDDVLTLRASCSTLYPLYRFCVTTHCSDCMLPLSVPPIPLFLLFRSFVTPESALHYPAQFSV